MTAKGDDKWRGKGVWLRRKAYDKVSSLTDFQSHRENFTRVAGYATCPKETRGKRRGEGEEVYSWITTVGGLEYVRLKVGQRRTGSLTLSPLLGRLLLFLQIQCRMLSESTKLVKLYKLDTGDRLRGSCRPYLLSPLQEIRHPWSYHTIAQ